MTTTRTREATVLALGIIAGLGLLGWLLGGSLIRFKQFERTVTVVAISSTCRPGNMPTCRVTSTTTAAAPSPRSMP